MRRTLKVNCFPTHTHIRPHMPTGIYTCVCYMHTPSYINNRESVVGCPLRAVDSSTLI